MRRVATPEGSRYYKLPIGAPITADAFKLARMRNGGKPAPKGASKTSSITRHAPGSGLLNRSTAAPKIKGYQVKEAGSSNGLRPLNSLKTKGGSLHGPKKITVGGNEFNIPAKSKAYGPIGGSGEGAYVITPEGDVHVFNKDGEVDLNSAEQAFIKGQLTDHTDSLKKLPQSSSDGKPSEPDFFKNKIDGKVNGKSVLPDNVIPTQKKSPNKPTVSSKSDKVMSPPQSASSKHKAAQAEQRLRSTPGAHTDEATGQKFYYKRAKPVIPDSTGSSLKVTDPTERDDISQSPYSGPHFDPKTGEWSKERSALHDEIVNRYLDGIEPTDNPVQYMNGGGPASGKGSLSKADAAKLTNYPPTRQTDEHTGELIQGETAPQAVLIDPDALKLQLPEVKDARARISAGTHTEDDEKWSPYAHEEGSYIAKRLHMAALERGVPLIYDGTGDSGVASVKSKVDKAREHGYSVEANYLAVDVETALARAKQRAKRTGRHVPEERIRKTYEILSKLFPELSQARLLDKLRLFDNNGDRGEPARLIFEGDRDHESILDDPAYKKFLEGAVAKNIEVNSAQQ